MCTPQWAQVTIVLGPVVPVAELGLGDGGEPGRATRLARHHSQATKPSSSQKTMRAPICRSKSPQAAPRPSTTWSTKRDPT